MKAPFIQQHHVGAGLFGFDQFQGLFVLDLQLVAQHRHVIIEINVRHGSVPVPPFSGEKPAELPSSVPP